MDLWGSVRSAVGYSHLTKLVSGSTDKKEVLFELGNKLRQAYSLAKEQLSIRVDHHSFSFDGSAEKDPIRVVYFFAN